MVFTRLAAKRAKTLESDDDDSLAMLKAPKIYLQGMEALSTPVMVNESNIDYWNETPIETEWCMANLMSSMLSLYISRTVHFQTFIGGCVEDMTFVFSTHAQKLTMSFANMVELCYVITSKPSKLEMRDDGLITSLPLGVGLVLTTHPGSKVFSLSKSKLAHSGLNQLVPPIIFLQSIKHLALLHMNPCIARSCVHFVPSWS